MLFSAIRLEEAPAAADVLAKQGVYRQIDLIS
jgi:hypothetical protein